MRSSIYLSVGGLKILVDTSPDFREQALRHDIRRVDHLFITHAHVDHLFGLDDIRRINTVQNADIPLHAAPETLTDIRRIFDYVFRDPIPGTYRPKLTLLEMRGPILIDVPDGGQVEVAPVDVVHGHTKTLGYVFTYAGRRFGYVPDCHEMPPATKAALSGIDLLVLDTLKRTPHPTHLTLEAALSFIDELKPRRALLTHIGHSLSHAELEAELAAHGPVKVAPAYDGLEVEP